MRALVASLLLAIVPATAVAAPSTTATQRVGNLDGVAVVDRLDASELAPGQVHRFWFRAGESAIAQGWYVPVIVVRGAHPGPRLLLTAAIHGDELNGIDVIQQLVAGIDPAKLSGTVIAVPGLNTPGLLHSTREFVTRDDHAADNLNRLMPGDPDGGAAAAYAARLWRNLLRPNTDTTIDLHTQSRGTAYVLYAFASNARARRIAELIGPDVIKLDLGVKGTVENEMVRDGVPAITLELGAPEVFDTAMVKRGVAGIRNVMHEMKMLPGGATLPVTGLYGATFTGNALTQVEAPRAGFARLLVPLGSTVTKGQPIATISDAFGRITDTIAAPRAGVVNTVFTDPRREAGSVVARIVYWSDDPACRDGC